MMKFPTEVDVLVVGGSLVGLTLVNALKGSRLRVALIDSQPVPPVSAGLTAPFDKTQTKAPDSFTLNSGVSPRVSAINLASENLLKRLDAWPEASTQRQAYTGMRVWDSRGTAAIEFDATMTPSDHLGTLVENVALTQALYQQALSDQTEGSQKEACHTEHKHADISLGYGLGLDTLTVVDDGYLAVLTDGTSVRTRLLVGADGGASAVRQLTDLKITEWSYAQQAMVTTIETELDHEGIARQCFTPVGPLALLPLSNPRWCSIVWSSDEASALMALDDEQICRRLTIASESVLGAVLAVDRRQVFPLQQRHALRYVKPGLALIGDAAHTIHPLAGQGANLGLADAQALARELQQCRFDGGSPGDISRLRRYQRSRQPANVLMTAVMEGFKRLFDSSDPGVNWLRNMGMSMLSKQGTFKAMVARLASGV
jgi:2-octaprenylphenol hydroxylase